MKTVEFSRRRALVRLACTLPGLLWASMGWPTEPAGPVPSPKPVSPRRSSRISVSLDQLGQSEARVEARVSLESNGTTFPLQRIGTGPVYEGTVAPGKYTVVVLAEGFETVRRDVTVEGEFTSQLIYLGKPGWPFFRIEGNRVPFEPDNSLLSVYFYRSTPSPDFLKKGIETLRSLGLEQFERKLEKPIPSAQALDALFFRLVKADVKLYADDPHASVKDSLFAQVIDAFPGQAIKYGLPLAAHRALEQILTADYVIRPAQGIDEQKLQTALAGAEADVVQKYGPPTNAWHIRFRDPSNYLHHLQSVESWRTDGLIAFGEPSILGRVQLHSPIADVNDPWRKCQTYLDQQSVVKAWNFIAVKLGRPEIKFGSKQVVVATLDEGLSLPSDAAAVNPDINRERLLLCHDLKDNVDCCSLGNFVHGMQVYGIIAARPDNSFGIAGIASNTSHIAARHPDLVDDLGYSRALQWLGGIPGALPVGTTLGPLPMPAHIINCSHGAAGLAIGTLTKEALPKLTSVGRGKLGVILVYSSGDDHDSMSAAGQALAMDPNTISVGNTTLGLGLKETRSAESNTGPKLDLCALGEQAPSLIRKPDATANCPVGGDPANRFRGVNYFGATSAAAPMVSATAALMLSVNPKLSWIEVRDILRATADKIDISDPGWTNLSDGAGTPTRGMQWRNDKYGYGRLNVLEAVKAAAEAIPRTSSRSLPAAGSPTRACSV